MSLELEKSMRIINDLVSFCYYEGADDFTMSLNHRADNTFQMQIACPIQGLSPEKVAMIRQTISLPREHEVEQQYWELSGETEFSGELSLVGAMSDEAEVQYDEGILRITVLRKE